ncbi:hypothetical protein ACFONN_06015 [Dyella humi]|uniref:NACHT domain-containing protein n=1 Tax=Dyella humi TaxID=1770547 RepID=A0ABW8IHJ0_9GAMM
MKFFQRLWKTEDRRVQIGRDNNGIVITGDNANIDLVFVDARAADTDARRVRTRQLTIDELRLLAIKLIEVGKPPSLIPLFPGAAASSFAALDRLSKIRRTVSGEGNGNNAVPLLDLSISEERHHLITALPGSGKTYALWQLATDLLESQSIVPLFLPISGAKTWSDVEAQISEVDSTIDVLTLLQDERVIVLLDGWSQFAVGDVTRERSRALRVLGGRRVIANGRLAGALDAGFRMWSLDKLSNAWVSETVLLAFPSESAPPAPLFDLLCIPLALALYVLLGGKLATRGQLLSKLHDSLSEGFPDAFRDVLSRAAARIKLSKRGDQYSAFENEVREQARPGGVENPTKLLDQLGTIVDRADRVLPIHDLYWSWLVGVGLLLDDPRPGALQDLTTRESYDLALQSGAHVRLPITNAVTDVDIVLAATFATAYNASSERHVDIERSLASMFSDERLPVKCRAAQAAFKFGRVQELRQAFGVVSELALSKVPAHQLMQAIDPNILAPHQVIASQCLGKEGSELLVDVIADRGGPEWVGWLERAATSQMLPFADAAAAAMACTGKMPDWVRPRMSEVIGEHGSLLRPIIKRGNNVEVARWLAEHYQEFVVPTSGLWFRLNEVLVSCRDESVIQLIFQRFSDWSAYAQETVAYAIVKFGESWLARFQEKVFAGGDIHHLHELKKFISRGISEKTACQWVENGPVELGWRTLIALRGHEVVTELTELLPSSFDGVLSSEILNALKFVERPPASVASELVKRVRGVISPKVMQDIIIVLGHLDPRTIMTELGIVTAWLPDLPIYHVNQFVKVLNKWERDFGFFLKIKLEGFESTVADWLLRDRLRSHGHDVFFKQLVMSDLSLAIQLLLAGHWQDDASVKDVVSHLTAVAVSYDEKLFNWLLSKGEFAQKIPFVFAKSIDSVPEAALKSALAVSDINFRSLVSWIGSRPSAVHLELHREVLRKAMGTTLDLYLYRDLAKVLQVHSRIVLLDLLSTEIPAPDEKAMWLIREIELTRSELLIDESGKWLG